MLACVKLGNLKIGEKTRYAPERCIPRMVGVIQGEKFLKFAFRAKKIGVDLLEMRIDRFANLNPEFLTTVIRKLKSKTSGLPILATIRHKDETDFRNVRHNLSEKERLLLFRQVIPLADGIDVELRAKEILNPVVNFARKRNKTVIISYHNFKETLPNSQLNEIVSRAKKSGADIVKLALFANRVEDVARLMLFTYSCPEKPLAVISLGKTGAISRLVGSCFGSCLTYGFVNERKKYGQLSLKEILRCLNYSPSQK